MSELVTADWLTANGWEQTWEQTHPMRSAMFWHNRSVPFVMIRLCDVYPRLQIGSSAIGWHYVTDQATPQDVIDLVKAMKITLEASAATTEHRSGKE